MKRIKTCVIILLCIAMTMGITSAYAKNDVSDTESSYSDNKVYQPGNGIGSGKITEDRFEILLSVNTGTSENQIGYIHEEETYPVSAEDFIVFDDGRIAVLDSTNYCIKEFTDGEMTRVIKPEGITYPSYFVVYDGCYYVLDSESRIFAVDMETGEVVGQYALPNYMTTGFVIGMFASDSGVYVYSEDYVARCITDKTKSSEKLVTVNANNEGISGFTNQRTGKKAELDCYSVCFLGYDANDSSYISVYEPVENTSVIMGETSLHCFDKEGNFVGCARIPLEECDAVATNFIEITPDGSVYTMVCAKDRLTIYKITLGDFFTSKMSELTEEAKQIEKSLSENEQSEANTNAMRSISRKRSSVNSTASSLATFTWVLDADNKYTRGSITLPSHIANASGGTTLTGMPYCRGCWDTKSQFNTKRGTTLSDGHLYTTGNITSPSYPTVSTGQDCSGFISVVYGFGSRMNTNGLASFGSSISKSNLRYMDFMVDAGNHVVLFVSFNPSTNRYTVYDASSTAVGRVSSRTWSASSLSAYQARTPWNVTCTPGGAAQPYDDLCHIRYCTDCGYAIHQAHTWVAYSTYHRCSECGEISTTVSAESPENINNK